MSFLELETPTLLQQLRPSPSLKRRNASKGSSSPPSSPTSTIINTMKPLPTLPNPVFKASLPVRRKARDNLPPPLHIVSPSYSSHTLNLPPTTAPPGFEPLSPFVAPSDASVGEVPDSPTSLHSPSLWLSPTGLVEPVGPTMSAGSYVSCHWVVDDAEDPFGRVNPITLPQEAPSSNALAPPVSAFDSDDESDEEHGVGKRSSMRRKMRAFVWGSTGKGYKSAKGCACEDQNGKKTGSPRYSDNNIKMSLFSKTTTPSPTPSPSRPSAMGTRRPSLVESLLLSGNTATTSISDSSSSPQSATSSPQTCIQPYPYSSVPKSRSPVRTSTAPSRPHTHNLAEETHRVQHRVSAVSTVDSLFDFDLDLFPMLAGDNSIAVPPKPNSYEHLFQPRRNEDSFHFTGEDDHDGRSAVAIVL